VSYDPGVRELQTGLWHWQAPHPSWREEADWPELVSSYAIDDGERLLLFDPLALPAELEALAAERATEILLTCPWHRRDADELAGRLGATIFVPPPDEVDQEPVGRDRYAAKVVPDAVFRAGDRPSHGVEAFAGLEPNDLVLWVESRRALVAGDTIIDRGNGFEVPTEWANTGVPRQEVIASLRPLLALPVELLLPTHGEPGDRAGLGRALG
jgi:glyoxylase-like metal-dependent hydrolase (beta-lactamase superfamily II)